MTWLIVAAIDAAGPAARPGRFLGISHRAPAGPVERPLRPVLASARRCAGAPRGGGACSRDRRLRRPVSRFRGPDAGGAGRRGRARVPARARARGERAFGRAGGGRPGVAAGRLDRRAGRRRSPRATGPPIPQRRRPGYPRTGRATPGARPPPRRNRGAAKLFRDRRATARAGAQRSRPVQPPHVGAGGPVGRHRCGAVAVRFGSGHCRWVGVALVVHRRRGSAARRAAGRGRRAGAGRGNRSARYPGRHGGTHLAARRGLRVQRRTDRQRGVLLRPPHAAVRAQPLRPHRIGAPLHPRRIAGVPPPTSRSWSPAARRYTRCSCPSCSPRRPRWPTTRRAAASSRCNPSAEGYKAGL